MSAPLVVNTSDGTCWTRRHVTRDGLALYAPEGVCQCPPFVMATLAELAEHGISGSADVLPMPVGPEPQTLGAERLSEIRKHVAGIRNWSLGNLAARDLLAEVDRLLAERHVTNEALDDAVQALRKREQQDTVVSEFVAARAEYITAIRNCHPDNGHDYDRWQGHAAARRQLSELLGLPVAWPLEDAASVVTADKLARVLAPSLEDPHDSPLHHEYRISHDLPPIGGA